MNKTVRPAIYAFTLYNATKSALSCIKVEDFRVTLKVNSWRVEVVASKTGSILLGCLLPTDLNDKNFESSLKKEIVNHFVVLVESELEKLEDLKNLEVKQPPNVVSLKNYGFILETQKNLKLLKNLLKDEKNYDLDSVDVTSFSYNSVYSSPSSPISLLEMKNRLDRDLEVVGQRLLKQMSVESSRKLKETEEEKE